jgi:hypothetical protein
VRKREPPTLSATPLLMSFDDGGLIPVTPEMLEKSDKKSGKIAKVQICPAPSSRLTVCWKEIG